MQNGYGSARDINVRRFVAYLDRSNLSVAIYPHDYTRPEY